ncbi:sodium- and chloride-dependent betaine transporter-like isoform X1 [Synchiropus splendidus]|uniref:sodium- and chloride-dependent betaine transporter-like isoform X1 n=1 Tax=Synchiropus splendidus TaxID=270530 RepID=UPI00237EADAE|nr:sodium- and chloride-dependent betaine transporter-like isoform X1 [Synchiropus splendidus]
MSEEAAAAESPAAAEAAKREASGAGDALARARWSNKREQLLSMSALIIGLGNIWRFPYLCYRNGGATFLVPYFLLLLFLGLPLFFLETALGQFTSQGAVTAWRRICPMLEGVGVASLVVLIYLNIYYIVVMAWTIFYFVHSFKDPLPWSTCDNSWNSELCQAHQSVYANPHLYQPNASWSFLNNISLEEYFINSTEYGFEQYRITSEDEFWTNRVLRVRDSMAIGAPHWDLALCLLLAWIICYFCIFKGIRLSGKVVYVTATLPYLLMFILFVRGVTLPGAGTGLRYFLVPSFSKLADLDVWQEAASQVIFSHAVGHGVLTSMSSYNTYNNNCYRDSLLLCGLNAATGVFGGLVVFSVLGFLAQDMAVSMETVASSGPGLVFMAYPRALSLLPAPRFWTVLFFIMIFLLGIDSQFLCVESMVTTISDLFPARLRRPGAREILVLLMAGMCFLIGLLFVTKGGIILFHVIDEYGPSGTSLLLIAGVQSVAVAWIYGADRFLDNIKDMTGVVPLPLIKYCWLFITPLLCGLLLLVEHINMQPLLEYQYVPGSVVRGLAALVLVTPLLMIPIFVLVRLCRSPDSMTAPDRSLRQAWPHRPLLTLCKRVVLGPPAPPTQVQLSEKEAMEQPV